MGTGSLPQR